MFAFASPSVARRVAAGETKDAIVDAALDWRAARGSDPDAIASIEVTTYALAIEATGNPDPRTPYEAKFSLPYAIAPDVQKRVPWVTWLSREFQQRSGITQTCLNQLPDRRLSHDNLFHSVLGLLNVQTQAYQAGLDAYAPCVRP